MGTPEEFWEVEFNLNHTMNSSVESQQAPYSRESGGTSCVPPSPENSPEGEKINMSVSDPPLFVHTIDLSDHGGSSSSDFSFVFVSSTSNDSPDNEHGLAHKDKTCPIAKAFLAVSAPHVCGHSVNQTVLFDQQSVPN